MVDLNHRSQAYGACEIDHFSNPHHEKNHQKSFLRLQFKRLFLEKVCCMTFIMVLRMPGDLNPFLHRDRVSCYRITPRHPFRGTNRNRTYVSQRPAAMRPKPLDDSSLFRLGTLARRYMTNRFLTFDG